MNIKHIAFIMDGNGRYAKKRNLPRTFGHKKGIERIKEIVLECFETYDIKTVTLYAFSTENWNRPPSEIKFLFLYLKAFFLKEINTFIEKGIKINILGFLDDERIPKDVKEVIDEATDKTKDNDKYTFNILFNYGGRQDIIQASLKLSELLSSGTIKKEEVDDNLFKTLLLTSKTSDVDLLIRTSGEERLSNCLLYQCAYSEFIFTPTYWPDFDKEELKRCLDIYNKRDRRFGAIKNDQ